MGALSILKNIPEQEHESFWFYVKDNASNGPFSKEEIEKCISDGKLQAGDFCWRQGFDEWRPVASTQEFSQNFSEKMPVVPYPKIDVPSKLELRIVGDLKKKEVQNQKKVVVQLAKAKKYYFSLYEWTFALLFSIGLAYLTATFALGEVKKSFKVRRLQSEMGEIKTLGYAANEVELSAKFIAPLLAAPGLEDYPFPIAVKHIDYPQGEATGDKSFSVGHYTVKSQEPLLEANEYVKEIDTVYRHSFEVHGQLFLNRPREILVNNPGSPLVFSH